MCWLLFMDESGHDHRSMPYEVRGGVALHSSKLWPFIQQWKRLEEDCFGTALAEFRVEIKGNKLLERQRFRWAAQEPRMENDARRAACRRFLTKGLERKPPSAEEFCAYGQASLDMAVGILELLTSFEGRLFAAAIPRGATKPPGFRLDEYLRKDHVFLFERFFYFLEEQEDFGLLVMDETEKWQDRRFVERLHRYFLRTDTGRSRATLIVPSPFFVSSDMAEAVQAADLCIYAVNWGFRLPSRGMDSETRQEISDKFGFWLSKLQYQGQGHRGGDVFPTYGIVYVPDPYVSRSGSE